jgi:alkylation response protein AidB-like acyl-CoA dehydrogenase
LLSGRKGWVAGAAAASDFLVSARTAGGISVFHVPRHAHGVKLSHSWQADGTPSFALELADVELPASSELLPAGSGAGALARALDAAAVVASAELMGVARAAFEMTLAYMRTRVQFEKPIGSFQALQHKAADLLVQRELGAAVLEEAVAAFDAGDKSDVELGRIASRCKARCSDAALRITRECIQLHGAIGYTHEYDIGLYLKRALVLAAWLGNGSQHRRRHFALSTVQPGSHHEPFKT